MIGGLFSGKVLLKCFLNKINKIIKNTFTKDVVCDKITLTTDMSRFISGERGEDYE